MCKRAEQEPDELADRARFRSRATIERHLFNQFVPAVFAKHPEQEVADHSEQKGWRHFRYTPQQAQHRLAFLAESHPRQNLACWEFDRTRDLVRADVNGAWS